MYDALLLSFLLSRTEHGKLGIWITWMRWEKIHLNLCQKWTREKTLSEYVKCGIQPEYFIRGLSANVGHQGFTVKLARICSTGEELWEQQEWSPRVGECTSV